MDGSGNTVSVVLVDGHRLFREGLRDLLIEQGIEVLGEAASAAEAVSMASKQSPAVALIDVQLTDASGIEATRQLRERRPETRVVILTSSRDQVDLVEAIQAGASGYLLKGTSIEEVVAAVRGAADGEPRFSPPITAGLLQLVREMPPPRALPGGPRLSQRELQVLRLIADGKGNPEIAQSLGISEQTVKTHVSAILEKLGVENRIQAAVYAVRNGLI
jgi:DNA-binding NarL/FixJ family response regulator